MIIIINNKKVEVTKNLTLLDFLTTTGKDPEKVLVSVNGSVIEKYKYNETVLNESDNLDLMAFVGGG